MSSYTGSLTCVKLPVAMTRRENTRALILDAAWTLVADRGAGGLTMSGVARATGISRQAVHQHFATRARLLAEMAAHHDESTGFVARIAALGELPPVDALERLVRMWCAYVPEIFPVAQALQVAHAGGDEAATAHLERMEQLHAAFARAVERVAGAGRLAEPWTVTDAADWVWARTHLTVWQHLVLERGWTQERYAERVTSAVLAELVTAVPRAP